MVILLVGNKSDLADEQRKVDTEEIEKYCATTDQQYLEVSALDSTNVDESFNLVVERKYPYFLVYLLLPFLEIYE